MSRQVVRLEDLPGVLAGLQSRRFPEYLVALKGAGLAAMEPDSLVRRRLTGTAKASEAAWEGDPRPYARDLDYETGHRPETASERQAVNRAAGPWGAVGSANDARHNGVLYVVFIERKDGSHAEAHAAMPDVLRRASGAAWREARNAA